MKYGRYSRNTPKRRLRWNKMFVLLVSMIVLLACVVGGSLAYLFTNSTTIENSFTPGNVELEIVEPGWDTDQSVKRNVSVKNIGNTDAKVRVMLVATWQKANGEIYPGAPVLGIDYTIKWDETGLLTGPDASVWSGPVNGWYTHISNVSPESNTSILFAECKAVDAKIPEGYSFVVDIIAEAIQADGGASW